MGNIRVGSIELEDWYYVEPNVCARDSRYFANDHTFVEISDYDKGFRVWIVGALIELQFMCPPLSGAKSFDEAQEIVDQFLVRMSKMLAFA